MTYNLPVSTRDYAVAIFLEKSSTYWLLDITEMRTHLRLSDRKAKQYFKNIEFSWLPPAGELGEQNWVGVFGLPG